MINDIQFKRDFNEADPAKKDVRWADRIITQLRYHMKYLVAPDRAAENRAYLAGTQSMDKHKKKFHKPEEVPVEFGPLGIMEKYVNILTAEREKAGVYISLSALDPTAQTQREFDYKLLKNSSWIEGLLSYAQQSIGMPKYEIATDKQAGKAAKGNLDTFKTMNLDPNSPADIAYFFQTHFRLDVEIEGEMAVNHFVRLHEIQEFLKDWCDDIIAVKAIAGRTYTNKTTFMPAYAYLRPETVRWIRGKRRDGKDARSIMSEESVSVAEMLEQVGSQITPENVMMIIDSVNYFNSTSYDGLCTKAGTIIYNAGCSHPCEYDHFLSLKVNLGYIEWKSIECKTRKSGVTPYGNFTLWDNLPYDYKMKENESSYKKEQVWNVVTYKSYFVATTSNTQLLFDFGKLFNMDVYGPEDEYSSFSFQVYKQPGLSAIEVAKPFIDNIHDAWFRFNWLMNKARPKGTRYNYNVIAKIATKFFKKDREENGVMKVIEMFQKSIDDFYVNDSLNPNVGGGQNPHFEKPSAIDQEAIKMLYDTFLAQQDQIAEKLGINAVREAYSPNPNDGYKLQMQALAQSRNATEYMSRMIMNLLMNYAKQTLGIVQTMIEVPGSSGYKHLEDALGIKTLDRLKALKGVPIHRYGIFIDSFNTDVEKQQQQQEALQAFQQKEIPYHVYMMLKTEQNYKKAAQILAYEKGKDMQRQQEEAERQHQQQMEQAQQQHQIKMEQIAAEFQGKQAVQQLANQGMIQVAQINQQGHLQSKQLSVQSEPMRADVRANAKIKTDEAAERRKRQEPLGIDEV